MKIQKGYLALRFSCTLGIHNGVPGFELLPLFQFQLSIRATASRLTQALGTLPPVWEIWIEFPLVTLVLAQP